MCILFFPTITKDVLFAVGVGGEVVFSVWRGMEKLEIPVILVE